MKLYEPFAFLLASILILVVWGELFTVFRTERERDCHARNEQLLRDGAQGPLQECDA